MGAAVVAELRIPDPPPLITDVTGAVTQGQAYRLSLPSLASGAVTIKSPDGSAVFSWTPTELVYRDAQGALDYWVGSSPASVETAENWGRFNRVYPQADDVFIAEADRVKHYTNLYAPPRPPADYLQGGILFGMAGLVTGTTMPIGTFSTILAGVFSLPTPVAFDLRGRQVEGKYEVVDADGGQQLFVWFDAAFFLDPSTVYPIMIDPTVSTSSSASATGQPNQRKCARFANGVLLDTFNSGTNIVCRYSTDNGTTWNAPATGATVVAGGTFPSQFIDEDDFIHVVTISGTTSMTLTYVRGTPDANRTSYTWSALQNITATNTPQTPDVVAHKEGTGYKAHLFWTEASTSPNNTTFYRRMNITNASALTWDIAATAIGASSYGVNDYTYPSAALDSSKNLYVSWQTGVAAAGKGVRFAKGTYSAGAWTWPSTSAEVITEAVFANQMGPCLVDSQGRAVVAFRDSSASLYIRVFRRSAAGAWVDISPATLAGQNPTLALDASDNIYLLYTNNGLFFRKYDGSTWAAAVTADATTSAAIPSARRDSAGAALDVVYQTGTANPWTVAHYRLVLNTAPTAPDALAPDSGAGFDGTTANTLSATAHDSPGDYPSNVLWEISENVSGSTVYYVKADGTLATVATWIATGGGSFNLSRQIAAGALVNGKSWKWRVTTQDAAGAASPASAYAIFKTSAPPTTTITSPAAGATIAGPQVTITASVADPEGRPLGTVTYRLYADNAGVKGSLIETQTIAALSKTMGTDMTPYNSLYVWVEAQTTDGDGVAGAAASRRNLVSFTSPTMPTLTATAQNANGRIRIQIANPAPGVGQPNIISNDVYKLIGAVFVRIGTGVAVNGTFDDYAAPSGIAQTYRIQAIGDTTATVNSQTAQATLTLSGLWLHDVTDPAGTALRLVRNTGRRQNWAGEFVVRHLAGRSLPVAESGVGEDSGAEFSVLMTAADAAWAPLLALIKRKATLCVRDNSGRRLFGIIPKLPEDDMLVGGQTATLAVTEIDYTEAV